ncbi:GNAT family N-acetyltransferase [Algibacter sp. 2305UL17-15]|uniref:GNAT family N-acetyltransferase n=1 Tax=Algibacter sp. 2305UL17-15 TaxID=3231268 RepID=UPI003459FA6D
MVHYNINIATENDILSHLIKCDNEFFPKLSERVNIEDYATKLFKMSTTFEAWDKKVLVGFIGAYFNKESKIAFISNLSVLPKYQNKGIASKLINQAVKYAISDDFDTMKLEVNSSNEKVISFYRKHNFKCISKNLDIVTMSLELK